MKTDMRTALMLILHGSPYPESNLSVEKLASQLTSAGQFIRVLAAYMECNRPSIPEGVDICAQDDVERIIAVPWFLHAGRHLVLDVPALLAEAAERHPHIQILLTDPIGMSPHIAEALAFRASEALK